MKIRPYIERASTTKNLVSYGIDLAFTFAVSLLLATFVGTKFIAPALGYSDGVKNYMALAVDSGLYVKGEEDDTTVYAINYNTDSDGNAILEGEGLYDLYAPIGEAVWNYYYAECAQVGKTEGTSFELTGFSGAVKGDADYESKVGEYIYKTVYGIEKDSSSNAYYTYPLAEDGVTPVWTSAPVLKADIAERIASTDVGVRVVAKQDLYVYMAGDDDDDGKNGIYGTAKLDLLNNQSIMKYYAALCSRASYLGTLPCYLIPPFIFFILIPAFSRRGKTLGKRFLSVSVLQKDGYLAKKPYLLLEHALSAFPFFLMALPLSSAINYLIIAGVLIADLLVLVFTPSNTSLFGLLSQTAVCDDKKSPIYFENEEEEFEYVSTHDDEITAKIVAEEEEEQGEQASEMPPSDAESAGYFDASMIGSARAQAESIESFDEFEARPVDEESLPQEEPEESEAPESPKGSEAPMEEGDPNDDEFVDGK